MEKVSVRRMRTRVCFSYVLMGAFRRDLFVLDALFVESLLVVSLLHPLGVSCVLGTNNCITILCIFVTVSLHLSIMFFSLDHVSLGSCDHCVVCNTNFIRLPSNVDAGGSGGTWTCTCAADGFPKVASDNFDTNCFTACNCTSGMLLSVEILTKPFLLNSSIV